MIDTKTAPYGALLLRVSMGILFILHGGSIKAFVFGMANAGKFFPPLWAYPSGLLGSSCCTKRSVGWRSSSGSTHDGSRYFLGYTCFLLPT